VTTNSALVSGNPPLTTDQADEYLAIARATLCTWHARPAGYCCWAVKIGERSGAPLLARRLDRLVPGARRHVRVRRIRVGRISAARCLAREHGRRVAAHPPSAITDNASQEATAPPPPG
jgi:hypothetical protein